MNQDDQLLKDLGRLAREQKEEEMRLDPRWESLSHQDLEEEAAEELRSLAERSPQMKAAWEAFRPLDRSFRRRILDRIREIFPQESRASSEASLPLETSLSAHAPSASPPVSWFSSSRWQLVAAASLSIVLVGLAILRLGNRELPEYSLEATGGVAVQRSGGESVDIPRLMEGVRLDLVLFPAEPVADEVALAVFLEQDGTMQPWRVPAERLRAAPSGSLKIELRTRDLGLHSGPAVLWLAVSRPCCLPGIEKVRELRRNEAQSDSGEVRWLRQEVLIEAPTPKPPAPKPPTLKPPALDSPSEATGSPPLP